MNLHDRFMQKFGRPPTEFDTDYLEMLNMSKYRILDIPDKKQAKCANCGSVKNDGRKYVDFGLEVDWYGIVYLCSLCMLDIANNMGLFNKAEEQIEQLRHEKASLINLLLAQGDSIENKLNNLMGEVREYFDALRTIDDGKSPDSDIVVDINASTGAENVTESDQSTGKTEQRTTESTAGSGLKNVSSLTELLNS